MTILAALAGIVLIGVILVDAFETVVLPRRVDRSFRAAIVYYRFAWRLYTAVVERIPSARWRANLLGSFGPASLLLLLGLWASGLILGFGLLQWVLGPRVTAGDSHQTPLDFSTALYLSGSSFFTLGYGDVTPVVPIARALAVLESGLGFGFLALIIGYLPALNGPLTQRELMVALLDARAGSPPTAAEVLRRHAGPASHERLADLLAEWERWAAGLLESHLSYPVLAFFRSQHDDHSWVSTLATVLDTSALLIVAEDHSPLAIQARLTYATARHAAQDISAIFQGHQPDIRAEAERLTPDEAADLWNTLHGAATADHSSQAAAADHSSQAAARRWQALASLRSAYEPPLEVLASYLLMPLPRFTSRSAPDPTADTPD